MSCHVMCVAVATALEYCPLPRRGHLHVTSEAVCDGAWTVYVSYGSVRFQARAYAHHVALIGPTPSALNSVAARRRARFIIRSPRSVALCWRRAAREYRKTAGRPFVLSPGPQSISLLSNS